MDPLKILLVDDSNSARYALKQQLLKHGLTVHMADSAESAFELLKGELPDAILMDHLMPGLNGLEALEVIREDPRTAHLPVVMCTSDEDADFAARAQRKGALGILPKSGAPEKLPAILAKLRDTIQVPSLGVGATKGAPSSPTSSAGTAPHTAPRPDSSHPAAAATVIDESRLLARLDERISSRMTALLDDLRRDLGERLTAEVHRELDGRLESERQGLDRRLQEQREAIEAHLQEHHRALEEQLDGLGRALEASRSQSNPAELQGQVERLVRETLPGLVKVEIEAERGQILALVEQYLRDLGPRTPVPEERESERLAAMDQAIARKAAEVAHFEAQTAIEAALGRQQQNRQPAPQVRSNLTGVYLAILAAALAGIGAAAAVYILLS